MNTTTLLIPELKFFLIKISCEVCTFNAFIFIQGLGLHVVESADDADFILAHGTEAIGLPSGDSLTVSLEYLESILERCAHKKIPMVVANPDYVTVEVRALRVMPGKPSSFSINLT